jgi:uncharacterized membrane protein HdeD (DUF308 family)
MSTSLQSSRSFLQGEISAVRKNWGWLMALGILQIVAGCFAVTFAFSATIASVVLLGVVLLVAGGAQFGAAILSRDWGGFFLFLAIGVLYAVTGFLTLQTPLIAAESLTLMLAAACFVGGIFRIVFALVEQVPSKGLVILNGGVTVALGVLIWRQWPASGLWVLGLFVGIDLIFNGATWTTLAASMQKGLATLSRSI